MLVSTTLSVTRHHRGSHRRATMPLVSIALGGVGRAPLLEDVRRELAGLTGLWMIWRALNHGNHNKPEGEPSASWPA
ncbi:hypothetical protein FJW08_31415 [Mesorhizobium sp. B3-2-1]|uniref:hypothetical protein n=1 Tax=Mesorhizobium sp. B3-2-1 TaxID=2589891 RepID=UPI00112B2E7D|nr:hypothetical protein [Mesorhizobium sp. B3-2-1]TPI21813.1 hypothetical protein FJW08_31415 [Mesorhizobium sp. B3-2-1]